MWTLPCWRSIRLLSFRLHAQILGVNQTPPSSSYRHLTPLSLVLYVFGRHHDASPLSSLPPYHLYPFSLLFRHALRRRRSLVAKRAISLAGISCRPLGIDRAGRGEAERGLCARCTSQLDVQIFFPCIRAGSAVFDIIHVDWTSLCEQCSAVLELHTLYLTGNEDSVSHHAHSLSHLLYIVLLNILCFLITLHLTSLRLAVIDTM